MSLDEQVDEYMAGLVEGMHDTMLNKWHRDSDDAPDYARGYAAGRTAYISAEKSERERVGALCPHCKGDPAWHSDNAVGKAGMLFGCTVFHGTGRRRTP